MFCSSILLSPGASSSSGPGEGGQAAGSVGQEQRRWIVLEIQEWGLIALNGVVDSRALAVKTLSSCPSCGSWVGL